MLIKIILLTSIILQLLSALVALRMIKITGYFWGWLSLSVAVSLMAIRRIISFYDLVFNAGTSSVNLSAEIVALIISVLVLTGIINILPILRSLHKAKSNLENVNLQLRKEVEQRKQSQKTASLNEEKFRKLAEYSPVLIWMSDTTALCTYFNQRWLDFRGRTMAEENGMGWTEGLHPDDKEVVIRDYLKAFKARESFELEYRLTDKNNEYRWIYDIGTPMYDDNNDFIGYIGSCIDITERKKIQKALKESEEKYRTIFNNSPLGIFRSTTSGQFLEVNPALAKMLGYETPKEVLNTIQDIAKQIYVSTEKRHEIIDHVEHQQGIQKFENVYKRKDGSHFTANLLLKPIKDKKGNIDYLEGILEDITKRKQAEEELKKSENQKALILGTMRESLVYMDTDLKVKWLNDAAKDLIPENKNDFHDMHCYELWHERKLPCEECPAKKCMETGKVEESEIVTNNKIYSVRAYPIKENQKIKGIIELGEEITERKKTEEALRASERRFKKIVNSLPQFVSYVDNNMIYQYVNQTYLERFNKNEDDIIGKPLKEVIGKDAYNKAKPHLDKVFKGEKVEYQEHYIYKNGLEAYMEGTLIPAFNEQDEVDGYYAILTDISHLIEAQEQLKKSRNRLAKLSEYQQELIERERNYIAREIHDELGQYLTAIHMGISWLKKQLGRDQMKLRSKSLEIIDLTNTTIQKVKTLSSELHPRIIDDMGLYAALEWYVNEFENNSQIICDLKMPEEEPEIENKIEINIFRIVQEALTNAYRHSNAKRIIIHFKTEKDYLFLQIADNGIGMNEDDKQGADKMGIIGMEERARVINADFNIESEKNKGTTIHLKIPIKQKDDKDTTG